MILKREKEMMFFGLSAEEHSMRGVGLFLFIYLGATLVASILTPPVYWAAFRQSFRNNYVAFRQEARHILRQDKMGSNNNRLPVDDERVRIIFPIKPRA